MTDLTKVIFRKWRGETVALFPENPADDHPAYCEAYWTGQYMTVDPYYVIYHSVPASISEYKSLKSELEDEGYYLKVVKRYTKQMHETRAQKFEPHNK
jgi:hypothetical protein